MPKIEVSSGELLDKWTILKIKSEKLRDFQQLENIRREILSIQTDVDSVCLDNKVLTERTRLYEINSHIWDLMEEIYLKGNTPDLEYLSLTVKITELNQQRAFSKKAIDKTSESVFSEAKSFFEDPRKIL